ncbi:MAG: 5'-methylthioadenosine/adenosylhomocysteine nucleosidase [Lachnospiraceae bacterium]|nr:5'-methylthioadenosine/adenosylhomocysteine nucleosidase [Lachnospiraceae bacterium]MDD3614768.1 5'-methylthioadenosine/adenosylhomocysteine nucleosidase [Lachnospiraceae bacterium]
MGHIGIIGAMDEEVAKIKENMSNIKITQKASMDFYEGTLNGKDVVVVRSGVGKVNAAVCTQILIDIFEVEAIINTGIAGSLRNEINIGDIVISTDVLHHDMNAVEFGYPKGQIPRMECLAFEGDEHLRKIAKVISGEVNPGVQVFEGRVVSGDQFIADDERKYQIVSDFAGYCTEMEGAAIGQAAYLNQIPFVIIRAISDKADHSANMDYPAFEKMAIENSVKLIQGMMESM